MWQKWFIILFAFCNCCREEINVHSPHSDMSFYLAATKHFFMIIKSSFHGKIG